MMCNPVCDILMDILRTVPAGAPLLALTAALYRSLPLRSSSLSLYSRPRRSSVGPTLLSTERRRGIEHRSVPANGKSNQGAHQHSSCFGSPDACRDAA